jgi:O-antigen/teichoic acid export membrane protein
VSAPTTEVRPETSEGAPPPLSGTSLRRHAIRYAIGNILTRAVAFLMLPIYTRYLTPADYGVAALVEMTLDVIGMIAGAGIGQGLFRFYHKADNDADRRAVVSTAMTGLTISFGSIGVVVFIAAPMISRLLFRSEIHTDLVRLAGMTLGIQGMIWVPLAYGRVLDRSGLVVGASVAKLLISVTLNLIFVVGMKLGVKGIFLSSFGANAALAIWLGFMTVRRVGFGIRPSVLKSLMRFGIPLVGVQMATFTMTFSDRYFLQAAGNESTVGIYSLAYQFGFMMLMLGFVPVEMVWGPRRFQVARGPNPSPVLAQAFRLINVSVFTVGVGIALFVADVLRIMSTPPFHPAANVVPILLIAYVFHGWAMMHDLGVLVKERTEFLTIANWVAALVALAAFATLVPRFYAAGAAMAAILAFGTRWGMTYYFSQRLWRVDYEWMPILRLAVVATAVSGLAMLLPRLGLVASIAVHALLFVLYVALVWIAGVLTPAEKRRGIEFASRFARYLQPSRSSSG